MTEVSVRARLYEKLEEIAEGEDMDVAELIDHALRSYVEASEQEIEEED